MLIRSETLFRIASIAKGDGSDKPRACNVNAQPDCPELELPKPRTPVAVLYVPQ